MKRITYYLILCLWPMMEAHSQKLNPGDSFEFELPKHYIVHKIAVEMYIDGQPNEEVWSQAIWTEDFIDIQGPDHPRPRYRTRVKMLWDDDFLYLFAELEEPHIWGDLLERDTVIFYNNDFEVFIKPDEFASYYGEVEVNALGTIWDLLLIRPYRNGGPAINHWNMPSMQVAISVNGTLNDPSDIDESWSVEMALPMDALREMAPRNKRKKVSDGDIWRLNFSRVQWQHEIDGQGKYFRKKDLSSREILAEDNWVWSPQYAINMHQPEFWGYLQFSDMPPGSEVIEIGDPWIHEKLLLFALQRKLIQNEKISGVVPDSVSDLGGHEYLINGRRRTVNYERTWTGYELSVRLENDQSLILNEAGELSLLDN